jgi:hypothetical protein
MTNKHKLVVFLQGMLTVAPSDDTLLALSAALTALDELVPENFAIAARELLEYMRRDERLDHSKRPAWLPEMTEERLKKQIEAIRKHTERQ